MRAVVHNSLKEGSVAHFWHQSLFNLYFFPKLSQVQKIAPPLMSFLRAFSVIEVFCHDDLTYFNEFLFKF